MDAKTRHALMEAVAPVLAQALAMEPEQREAAFGVLVTAIAVKDGLPALRAIVKAAMERVEARMAARGG